MVITSEGTLRWSQYGVKKEKRLKMTLRKHITYSVGHGHSSDITHEHKAIGVVPYTHQCFLKEEVICRQPLFLLLLL
jgi:hypothetical protein